MSFYFYNFKLFFYSNAFLDFFFQTINELGTLVAKFLLKFRKKRKDKYLIRELNI